MLAALVTTGRAAAVSTALHPRPLLLDVPAPAGFSWGGTFTFDEAGTAFRTATASAIDELDIGPRVGLGTQSEVRRGHLPGHTEPVAVKIGLKVGAIAREAEVLSAMSGVPGFPRLLHHEAEGEGTPGGALLLTLLGPSLDDLRRRGESGPLTGELLRHVGGCLLGLLRRLHAAGFVHNDVKPSNVLLSAGAAELHPASDLAADESRATRPSDDVESLLYTLAYLAAGRLPWQGEDADAVASAKRELLVEGVGAVAALTDGVECPAAAAALRALHAEVVRASRVGAVDYAICLAALEAGQEASGLR
ncbi:hypothetical protein EMIHUDRAFT_222785 [Emiliania huxleyi CCMP1516]|uniref:non-specific serine/threonine protein kinase n=2 Tax=Emiliania huxleyi TaxID=2903 RepID=A0A0D3KX60_EMIH1|nr:hypothetical protein EMIHUDRAFT_222785 [Emiliania huxleyi CCMP1516]EOD40345.1 hypothetical protein EMIHUDRAFT_222785 [Emiliania huxleyi CCMP1516]|eukprot:XP_005792774.1 hypothetical protein EMIHUDRAFT_222785 [Emiliania huxleyi CCMP1516]